MNAAVFLLNGVVKFDLGRFRPYIGAGVGFAYVTHDFGAQVGSGHPVAPNAQVINTPSGQVERLATSNSANALNNAPAGYFSFGSDNETTFAWQALAGVEFEVTPRWSIFTEYKALWFLDGPYYRNYLSQMVGAGIRYNF
jgi:opacity protein-like surface antigen